MILLFNFLSLIFKQTWRYDKAPPEALTWGEARTGRNGTLCHMDSHTAGLGKRHGLRLKISSFQGLTVVLQNEKPW